ncbi:hypothetical protein WDW37_15095 [Bdellovibrionota bacterium FG-1]
MGNGSELKRKLLDSWDQIRSKYPIVVAAEVVAGDPVKTDFLSCIDGLKTAEEIEQFFTLNASEAHLIFTDLMNVGAIRFLDDGERLGYLKRHAIELERNLVFLRSERERLRGESLYLNKQTREKMLEVEAFKTKIPAQEEACQQLTGNLNSLQAKSQGLWEQNAELFGVAKDVKHKTDVIKTGLEKLEDQFPKVMRKKVKVAERYRKNEEMRHTSKDKNAAVEKKLFEYHDALSEVREYLEDTKLRVKGFSEQD